MDSDDVRTRGYLYLSDFGGVVICVKVRGDMRRPNSSSAETQFVILCVDSRFED